MVNIEKMDCNTGRVPPLNIEEVKRLYPAQYIEAVDAVLAEKEMEIAKLKASLDCPICGGTGDHSTDGRPCACEGAGNIQNAFRNLQMECFKLFAKNVVTHEALERIAHRGLDYKCSVCVQLVQIAAEALVASDKPITDKG